MSTLPAAARAPSLVLPGDGIARRAVYLHPGHVAAARVPTAVTTILGSCVAVCLWDAARRTGGINHFLLPQHPRPGDASPRFGSVAMGALLDELARLGVRRESLQAKVFGGACVLEAFRGGDAHHLGERNVEVALTLLDAESIPVAARDTGGTRGRKLLFRTDDGTALVKRI